jgi:hypothetical protein
MDCSCLYSGQDQESHFAQITFALERLDIPGSSIIGRTPLFPAAPWMMITMRADGFRSWHVTPQPALSILLAGRIETTVGSGARRLSAPGDLGLALDALGRGHETRVLEGPVHALVLALTPAQLGQLKAASRGWPEDMVVPDSWGPGVDPGPGPYGGRGDRTT